MEVASGSGLTLDGIRAALAVEPGVKVHRASIGGRLHRLGPGHKTLPASGIKRPEVARARCVWRAHRQPFMRNMPERLAFIDVDAGKGIDPGDRYPR